MRAKFDFASAALQAYPSSCARVSELPVNDDAPSSLLQLWPALLRKGISLRQKAQRHSGCEAELHATTAFQGATWRTRRTGKIMGWKPSLRRRLRGDSFPPLPPQHPADATLPHKAESIDRRPPLCPRVHKNSSPSPHNAHRKHLFRHVAKRAPRCRPLACKHLAPLSALGTEKTVPQMCPRIAPKVPQNCPGSAPNVPHFRPRLPRCWRMPAGGQRQGACGAAALEYDAPRRFGISAAKVTLLQEHSVDGMLNRGIKVSLMCPGGGALGKLGEQNDASVVVQGACCAGETPAGGQRYERGTDFRCLRNLSGFWIRQRTTC